MKQPIRKASAQRAKEIRQFSRSIENASLELDKLSEIDEKITAAGSDPLTITVIIGFPDGEDRTVEIGTADTKAVLDAVDAALQTDIQTLMARMKALAAQIGEKTSE